MIAAVLVGEPVRRIYEHKGSYDLCQWEQSPRPRVRGRVGEGPPRGCGTSPRSGDGPEGDEGTRARPRESRKEIAGDGRGEGQARASEGGDPRARSEERREGKEGRSRWSPDH